MWKRAVSCFVPVLAMACSAVTSTERLPMGGEGADAGLAGRDAGPGPADAGRPPDAGTPIERDAGRDGGSPPPACVDGATRCEGEVLVTCESGREERTDCASEGDLCVAGDGGSRCRDRVCDPGSRGCSSDLRTSIVCDARGASETREACAFLCDVATGRCLLAPAACEGIPTIRPGTHRFNTCGQRNDATHAPMGDCSDRFGANGEDVILGFTLERDSDVVINLRDEDALASVDTIVYVRRVCDDGSTQVACDDDVPCSASSIPSGCISGEQVRESRIVTRLPAGRYYIVVDTVDYSAGAGLRFTCGQVRLDLEVR